MSKLIYKIAELKDLQRLKSEAEAEAESAAKPIEIAVVEFFEGEPVEAAPKAKPPEIQPVSDPMPKTLRGLSALDLSLLEIDGMLTPVEQAWYNNRRNRYKEQRPWNPSPYDWMK